MSPRAAARLETLGFTEVYDYVNGKADWLASALPTEGLSVGRSTAGSTLRHDHIVAHSGEKLGDVVARVRSAGRDAVIVINDRHVVLGRVRGRALEGDPESMIEDVMRPGPSTIRPDTPLETVVESLRSGNVESILVTDPDGRLIGTVYLEDAERKLAELKHGEINR